jgi:hypothetical protein
MGKAEIISGGDFDAMPALHNMEDEISSAHNLARALSMMSETLDDEKSGAFSELSATLVARIEALDQLHSAIFDGLTGAAGPAGSLGALALQGLAS